MFIYKNININIMGNVTISTDTNNILYLEETAKRKDIKVSAVATQCILLHKRIYSGDGKEMNSVIELVQDQLAKMGWEMKWSLKKL